MWEAGIKTSSQEANLSRVRTFKNIKPEEPFSNDYNLLSLLKARRGVKRGYGTTFMVTNSQQEFCIYDKNEEMRNKGIYLSQFPKEP